MAENNQGQQLLEALVGLGQLASQVPTKINQVAGPEAMGEGLKTLADLLVGAPTRAVGSAAGKASTIPQQQKLQQDVQGTQQRLEKMGLENTDPLKDATLKELVKIRKEQVREAVEMGVPVEQIQGQIEQGAASQPQAPAQSPMVQQPQQQAAQPQLQDPRTILEKLFGAVGFRESGASRLANVQADLGRQELLGLKPLQKGEREKLGLQFVSNVLQKTGQKGLSAEATKTLTNAKQGIEQTTSLLNVFEQDPDAFKTWAGPGDPRGQQIKVIRNNLADVVGRLRSGGAINKEEEKRFMGLLPKQGVISARTESPETVVFKLKTLNRMFNDITSGIQTSDQAGQMADRIQQALAEGYTPTEISQFIGF